MRTARAGSVAGGPGDGAAGTAAHTAADLADEITYAGSARTRAGRALIRAVEAAGGRGALIRRAEGHAAELARGRDVWEVMVERYGLSLELTRGSLELIPATGPLILVANHPFGILDGLMLGRILSLRRGTGFRILAHDVFRRAEALRDSLLPVDFAETPQAVARTIETRRLALSVLAAGGAIGIFPGGTVSTARHPFARAMDPVWRSFTARMIVRSGAAVVPLYFDGANSRLFQIASHVNYSLRVALLLREFAVRVDRPVRVAVGAPLPADEIAARAGDPRALMAWLRLQSYALAPRPLDAARLGHEFEAHHRPPKERPGRAVRPRMR